LFGYPWRVKDWENSNDPAWRRDEIGGALLQVLHSDPDAMLGHITSSRYVCHLRG
jgi:hypothetical protein